MTVDDTRICALTWKGGRLSLELPATADGFCGGAPRGVSLRASAGPVCGPVCGPLCGPLCGLSRTMGGSAQKECEAPRQVGGGPPGTARSPAAAFRVGIRGPIGFQRLKLNLRMTKTSVRVACGSGDPNEDGLFFALWSRAKGGGFVQRAPLWAWGGPGYKQKRSEHR